MNKETHQKLWDALKSTEAILCSEYQRQLTAQCEKVLTELAQDGWDANVRYDYPSSSKYGYSRPEHYNQLARYNLGLKYTRQTWVSRSPKQPDTRAPRTDNAHRIAEEAAKLAHEALEGFCLKLAGKIEDTGIAVESITYLGGTDPWGWTHVVVNNGEQVWRTKMIVNVSCLGKVFNQWPTRQVASVE